MRAHRSKRDERTAWDARELSNSEATRPRGPPTPHVCDREPSTAAGTVSTANDNGIYATDAIERICSATIQRCGRESRPIGIACRRLRERSDDVGLADMIGHGQGPFFDTPFRRGVGLVVFPIDLYRNTMRPRLAVLAVESVGVGAEVQRTDAMRLSNSDRFRCTKVRKSIASTRRLGANTAPNLRTKSRPDHRHTGKSRTIYVPCAAVSVSGGILARTLSAQHRESGLVAR